MRVPSYRNRAIGSYGKILLCGFTVFALTAVMMGVPLAGMAQGGAAPFAGAAKMSCDDALKQAPKDDPSLAPMDKDFSMASAKLKKSPKDAKVKKAYVDSAYKYGHQITYGAVKLSPPVKYRAGLALYRKVLAVDPKNAASIKEKDNIEAIYKQMGRDIPK